MKRMMVTVVMLAACSGGGRAGNPAVYDRIASMSDCQELQVEFDTAMDNAEARETGDPVRDASLGYAEAADERMRDLDCYE